MENNNEFFNNGNYYNPVSPVFLQKSDIKRRSHIVAFAMLLLFAIMIGWSFVYLKIAAAIGVSYTDAASFANDPFISQLIQVIISTLMLFLPFLAVKKCFKLKGEEIIGYDKPQKNTVLPFLIAGVGFCMFANISTAVLGAFFENMGFSAPSSENELPTGISGVILSVLTTAVLPALIEEFAMRGIVLSVFRKFGDGFAIIASSFIFAIMHANIAQIPFAFLVGIALAFITIKTNSIWTAAGVHFLNNFISVMASYGYDYLGKEATETLYILLVAILLSLFIFAVFVLQNKNREIFKLNLPEKTGLTEKQKFKYFFLSPVMIIATVVSLIIAFVFR